MEEERYTKMIFTSSEWLYIIASLGLSSNLMLANPYKGFSKEALQQEIARGRRGLEEKRMLERTVNQGWELDGRITALMNVISKADYTLSIILLIAPASFNQITYFFMQNQAISLNQESRYYHVGIYQGEKAVLNVLLTLLGVAQQLSQNLSSIRLPTANLLNLIFTIWRDPENAEAQLRQAGLTEEEAKNSAIAVSKSELISILTPEFKQQPATPLRRSYLLSGKTFLYWGEAEAPSSEFIQLNPLPFSHTAITKAPDFDETIIFDPSTPNVTANIIRLIKRGEFKVTKSSQEDLLI
ncbi:MAG: hypothetical protein DDG59_12345 [Anaerolineae bacterium]|jgi:hypothetical protein|nr:MAG: hypothetical protein DDG59_12345 [Anaerolineae bacterium]